MVPVDADVTERRKTEAVLECNQRFIAMLVNNLTSMVYRRCNNKNWDMGFTNKVCKDLTGYSNMDFIENKIHFAELIDEDDRQRSWDEVQSALAVKKTFNLTYRIKARDGVEKWVEEQGFGVFAEDGRLRHLEGFILDITERKLSEKILRDNLIEKDALLMELHHRVKNNMQVISSILSIQSRYVNVENVHHAFSESRQRIRAMALIHERLYTSKDLGHIDINRCLGYLSERLGRLHGNIHRDITINLDGDLMRMSVDCALPCILIVNELFTNAIKHAYAEYENVTIDVKIGCCDIGNNCQIQVMDHGAGFEAEKYMESPGTAGFLIVKSLIKQLGGEIRYEYDNGSRFTFSFMLRPPPVFNSG